MPQHAVRRASPFSGGDVLEHLFVEGRVGDHPFQLTILLLEMFQSASIAEVHPTVETLQRADHPLVCEIAFPHPYPFVALESRIQSRPILGENVGPYIKNITLIIAEYF